jgi:hypothetical protein
MDSQELMRDFLRGVVKPAIDKGVEPAQLIAVFLSAASILAARKRQRFHPTTLKQTRAPTPRRDLPMGRGETTWTGHRPSQMRLVATITLR